MKVIGYLRVSGLTQMDGDGFDRQSAAVTAFCNAYGLDLISECREEGVSGTVDGLERPQFSALLETLERSKQHDAEPLQAIVVERMDRLARDLMVSEMLLRECRESGIKVFSADQGNLTDMASDGGDPTRVLIRQIMGALAEWERSVIVKKLRVAKDRLKASGKMAVEGIKPYGYYAAEKPILDLMVSWYQSGKNYSDIAGLMGGSGCLTRSGRPFKPQNVRKILNTHFNNRSKQQKL